MKVTYLVNQYPMVSHSFIRREILALDRQGVEVLRYAVRGWDGALLVDPEDIRERERTPFVLQDGAGGLVSAVLRTALRAPGRFFAALRLAMKMGFRADSALPYHLVLLIEAAAAVACDGVDFELVLAVDGELRAQIEAGIARHGLARQVSITGWITEAQVRDEIQAASALVLPSFAEGLPVVVMEAMALRRPVLTTYVAGNPELVVHGEHGWLFSAGAVKELAAAMKACLAAPSEALAHMGNLARERVLVRHDVGTEAACLARFFRDAAHATDQAAAAA